MSIEEAMTQAGIRRPTYATPGDAVAKARELAPGIRARVPQAEELRRLPDDTVRELMDGGLFLLMAPRSMGGSELNYEAVLDVTIALGKACPSTGWVYALLAAHMWLLAEFPEHIQSSDMQRLWRDTYAAAPHHGLTWDVRGLEYGRVMMGLPAMPEQATGSVL
jgi:alkylation response protein AidB-like acyl-CoA dehydrogenase